MTIYTRETTGTGVTNKGAPLTNAEVDQNFIDLVAVDATKADLSGADFTGQISAPTIKPNQVSITVSGATTTIDLSTANHFIVTMTQNTTFALSNVASNIGCNGNIIIKENATGGFSFTLATEMKTPVNGATIVQSTGANEISVLSYHVLDASTVLVNYIGDFA